MRANEFAHNEALAYELAVRFYRAPGFEEIPHLAWLVSMTFLNGQ